MTVTHADEFHEFLPLFKHELVVNQMRRADDDTSGRARSLVLLKLDEQRWLFLLFIVVRRRAIEEMDVGQPERLSPRDGHLDGWMGGHVDIPKRTRKGCHAQAGCAWTCS